MKTPPHTSDSAQKSDQQNAGLGGKRLHNSARIAIAAISLSLAAGQSQAQVLSDSFTFNIDSSQSNAAMTVWGEAFGSLVSTSDTQNFSLAGTVTLDITADLGAGTVDSVGFVSMDLEYLTNLSTPTNFSLIQTIPSPFDGSGDGDTAQIRVPFDPAQAVGNNPPTQSEPLLLTLTSANAGTATNTGNRLTLADPLLQTTGLGQNFGFTPLQPSPGEDGFPINLTWESNGNLALGVPSSDATITQINTLQVLQGVGIGNGTDLQSAIDEIGDPNITNEQELLDFAIDFGLIPPGTTSAFDPVATDAEPTTVDPAPTSSIVAAFEVIIQGDDLVLEGDYFGFGLSTEGGSFDSGQIHDATFKGSAPIPEPQSVIPLALAALGFTVLARRGRRN